ncbi:MAG: DVUA0089 family protein [Acidobacteria bacterium]|nr:DVUA0089 family protein [Acidobacteriota bacterium]
MKHMLLLLCTLSAAADASILRTGVFAVDDDVQLFQVTLQSAGVLTVRSAGYGGDTGLSIVAGGFDSLVSLFDGDPAGLLLAVNNDGTCLDVSPDPTTGMCWDAFLTMPLMAGTYVMALTQYDNLSNGPALLDGFLRTGTGNFTPGLSGFPGTSFLDSLGNQRTGNWALLFDGASDVASVPEPAAGLLALCGLLTAAVRSRWRSRER